MDQLDQFKTLVAEARRRDSGPKKPRAQEASSPSATNYSVASSSALQTHQAFLRTYATVRDNVVELANEIDACRPLFTSPFYVLTEGRPTPQQLADRDADIQDRTRQIENSLRQLQDEYQAKREGFGTELQRVHASTQAILQRQLILQAQRHSLHRSVVETRRTTRRAIERLDADLLPQLSKTSSQKLRLRLRYPDKADDQARTKGKVQSMVDDGKASNFIHQGLAQDGAQPSSHDKDGSEAGPLKGKTETSGSTSHVGRAGHEATVRKDAATPASREAEAWKMMTEEFQSKMTPELEQQLQQENIELETNLYSLDEELRHTEEQLVELARMQKVLNEHLATQLVQMEKVYEDTEVANVNIEEGNQELDRARRANASCTNYMVMVFILLSFCVLFLDWYE